MPVQGQTPTEIHLNDDTPAAPEGKVNVKWQAGDPYPDPNNTALQVRDTSANFPNLGGVDARTGTSETISLASQGKLVTFSNASAVAVTLNNSGIAAGFLCAVENLGAGTVTLTPSSGTINGNTTLVLTSGSGGWLFFDGANWEAATGGSGTGFTAGGDLSGTSSSQEVIGIQNKAIDGGPTDGKFLQYSSSSGKWEPTAPASALPPSGSAGGDLGGTYPNPQVDGIQNKAIEGGPTDGDALVYSSGTGKWEPTALALKARAINTTAPLTGGGDLSADRTLASSEFTGDSGSGGAQGDVPAPGAGDAAAGKYLAAGGGWSAPPGQRAPFIGRKGDGSTGYVVANNLHYLGGACSLSIFFKPDAAPTGSGGGAYTYSAETCEAVSGTYYNIISFNWNGSGSSTYALAKCIYWNSLTSLWTAFTLQLPSNLWNAMVGTWNHLAIVNDGAGNVAIYLNGTSVATGSMTHFGGNLPANTASYLVALSSISSSQNPNAPSYFSANSVCEEAFYNFALTAADVANLNAGMPAYEVELSQLAAYWKFMGYQLEPDLSGGKVMGTVTDTTMVAGPTNCAASGVQGPTGETGAQGDKGGMRYTFDTTTSAGTSGNGDLRFNNGTIGSVTVIYLNYHDVNGVDLHSYISHWADSTSTVKGYLIIKENSNSGTPFSVFSISAIVNHTTYYEIDVTYVAGTAPTNANQVVVEWIRTGTKGDTGATGAQGPAGGGAWPLTSLSDTFPGSAIDTTKWCQYSMSTTGYLQKGTISVANNQLTIAPAASTVGYTGITSIARYDMRGKAFKAQVNQCAAGGSGSTDTALVVIFDPLNYAQFVKEGTTLYAQYKYNNTNVAVASITYNASTMAYWRIREASGSLYYEYSSNGSSWTGLGSAVTPDPVFVADVWLCIAAGNYTSQTSTANAIFSNVALS